MTRLTTVEALRQILADAGVRVLFREPRAVSAAAWPPAAHPPVEIIGLTARVVLAMADGYAQATGGLGVALVQPTADRANLIEPLLAAERAGTPLLVLAGPAGASAGAGGPSRPDPAKLVLTVSGAAEVPRATRRAIQQTLSPPAGPVLLMLPADLTGAISDRDLAAPVASERLARPSRAAVAAATNRLLEAEWPALLVGGGVVEPNVAARLIRLAEMVGATIYDEPLVIRGRPSALTSHPLHGGPAPLAPPAAEAADVLLVVGLEAPAPRATGGVASLLQRARLVWFGATWDPATPTVAPPVLLGGDPRAGLDDLLVSLEAGRTAAHQAAAAHRLQRATAGRRLVAPTDQPAPAAPMTTSDLALPPGAILVDAPRPETADPAPTGYRGWGAGWSVAGALGVALAWPERPIVVRLDRLSLVAGLPALWTAAHYRLPVIYLVDDRGQPTDPVVPSGAEIDLIGLARACGLPATRLAAVAALGPALAAAAQAGHPTLLLLPTDPEPEARPTATPAPSGSGPG